MKKVYIWYSTATNITGENLTKALEEKLDSSLFEVKGGKTKPSDADIIIGYGTKTSRDIGYLRGTVILNHPNNIRTNRNKLDALTKMKSENVPIPMFETINKALSESTELTYPVIARTKYHQGGRGLTICLSKKQIKKAASNTEFGYVQKLVATDKEYRVHVFQENIIYIAEKVIQSDPTASWKANYLDKIKSIAEKNEMELNNETADLCLKVISKDLTLPDLVVRSNKRGWHFKKITLDNITNNQKLLLLKDAAIQAVKAIGLDFGAVDCAIDEEGKAQVIEVNSGPGLQGSAFTAYVDSIKNFLINVVNEEENNRRERNRTTGTQTTMQDIINEVRSLNERISRLMENSR